MEKFKHVVGIIHTNYLVYTRSYQGGMYKEPLLKNVNAGMGRAYCHKIIKLSGLFPFPPSSSSFLIRYLRITMTHIYSFFSSSFCLFTTLLGALQEFAPEKEVITNVHGVRNKYLEIGDSALVRGFTKGAYFVGKLAWPKGFGEMFSLMKYLRQRTGRTFHLDVYGNGPHAQEIMKEGKGYTSQLFYYYYFLRLFCLTLF